jgi:branched-chain amino acid transport system ATP-binding protein
MTLRLRDVTAGYGSTTVLRGIDLRVPTASVVALLGANGAGKTTLLRVASGLLAPSAGTLEIDGEDVTGRRPHELAARGVCHVPEGRGVFRSLTVQENLQLQALPGQEEQALERAAEAFPKLGQRLQQVAGTMSGGEQQMLALARSYVQSPTLVLLDEVSMGLAPRIIDEIFVFLARLAEQGASLLLVEQYVTRALAVADYVYVLNKGEMTFVGEPSELEADDVFRAYAGLDEPDAARPPVTVP